MIGERGRGEKGSGEGERFSIYHFSFLIFHWETETAKTPRTAEFAKKR
jgi:hypothetical protein